MQDAPAASELPQVLLDSRTAPGADRDAGGRGAAGLVTVTDCAALVEPTATLPNDTLDGDAVSAVAPVTPVPVSATVSGLPARCWPPTGPARRPLAVGAKVTLTVHEPPAAMELPQVLVSANGPLTLTEETDAAVLPGFDTVTVCAELVEPTVSLPNDRLAATPTASCCRPIRRRGRPRTRRAARRSSRCCR